MLLVKPYITQRAEITYHRVSQALSMYIRLLFSILIWSGAGFSILRFCSDLTNCCGGIADWFFRGGRQVFGCSPYLWALASVIDICQKLEEIVFQLHLAVGCVCCRSLCKLWPDTSTWHCHACPNIDSKCCFHSKLKDILRNIMSTCFGEYLWFVFVSALVVGKVEVTTLVSNWMNHTIVWPNVKYPEQAFLCYILLWKITSVEEVLMQDDCVCLRL